MIGLKTWRVICIFGQNKRFELRYDETIHTCDTVVEAIGQCADISLPGEAPTGKEHTT